jgi:S-(hydroxymethyl)glutathione dehydrogenase / alcohol dehydrogenase
VKAALLRTPGHPLSIEDVVIANPAAHEVLIRTVACGLCHSDLHFIEGTYPHPLPCIPGHEAAGIVEAIGSEVRTVKVGDAVVTCLSAFCGACEFCVTGRLSLCVSSDTRRLAGQAPRIALYDGSVVNQMLNLSAFAEQMLIHENACVAINPDMPLDRAAILGCAVTTGAGTIFNACKVTPGETIAVIGCGGVGLATINAAKIAGAGRIIAVDPIAEKRTLAMKLGATDAIDNGVDGAAALIMDMTKGGVDHAIEAVGRPASASLAVSILKRGGMATILGMLPLTERVSLGAFDLLSGKKLQGALMGANRFPVDIPRLVDFYLRGMLDLDSIVAERIPLSAINEGFDQMKKGDAARSVVIFEQ